MEKIACIMQCTWCFPSHSFSLHIVIVAVVAVVVVVVGTVMEVEIHIGTVHIVCGHL